MAGGGEASGSPYGREEGSAERLEGGGANKKEKVGNREALGTSTVGVEGREDRVGEERETRGLEVEGDEDPGLEVAGGRKEEAQRMIMPPPSPKSQGTGQEDTDNGFIANGPKMKGGPNNQQGDSQEGMVTEREKYGHERGPTKGNYIEAPRRPRSTRLSEEATDRSPYKGSSIWEKQAWKPAPSNYHDTNKGQKFGMWVGTYSNHDVDRIGSSYFETENPHYDHRPPEIIWKTQPLSKTINQGRMYKDIMVSIGLNSPNNLMESRGEENREHNQVASLVNTPIRNSVSSLIALGQHMLTRR